MKSHDQDPSQSSRPSARRANIVGRGVGIWASLFGGEVATAIFAQPASATPEIIRHVEQGSQSFINTFDKRFAAKVKMMRSSPYFSSMKPHQIDKSLPADITIEYVGAPSKMYPGRYDWLAVTMKDGEDVPLDASLNLGGDSKKYSSVRNYKAGYAFRQETDLGEFTPKTMQLVTDGGTGSGAPTYYEASSEGHTIHLLSGTPRYYSSNAAEVSAACNAFLNQVQSVVTRK